MSVQPDFRSLSTLQSSRSAMLYIKNLPSTLDSEFINWLQILIWIQLEVIFFFQLDYF